MSEFREQLVKSKSLAESYVVLSIFKNTDLLIDNNIDVNEITSPDWKFYFALAKKCMDEGKTVLDDIVVGLAVAESQVLQKMYNDFGGWDTISNGINYVKIENFEGYLKQVKKYNAMIRLYDLGFPVEKEFPTYKTMSIEDIQNAYETALASIFADVSVEEKVEDLGEDLLKTVLEYHEGLHRGFPYASALLNEYTGGMSLGNITMTSANSGIGKTFLTLAQIMPNMIKYKESLMILANEEDSKKWKREIITWVVNNELGKNLQKKRFKQGQFTPEEMQVLKDGVAWLEENMGKGLIKFINFNSFSMTKAIKVIKKQSALYGTKYFILDTLKLDADSLDSQAWLSLQQNMVHLYDVVKPSNRNLHVWVTYQLGKSAMLSRYLSQNSLGVSKNVVDVVSTLLLVRRALDSEKEGGKNEVVVKTKNGNAKMHKDKEYFIIFLGKNRDGETHRQLVMEADIGRNVIKDFGVCNIPQDF